MTQHISIWILGNQLLTDHPALLHVESRDAKQDIRILLIESQYLLDHRPTHPSRLILLISAMRHYADHLQKAGFEVDYRKAPTFRSGIQDHLGVQSLTAAEYGCERPQREAISENHTPRNIFHTHRNYT
ncbi:MAG: cryptochrome/photolyase family protein [Anaerolineales bacterium]